MLLAGYITYLLFLIKLSNNNTNQLFILFGLIPIAIIPLFKYMRSKLFRSVLKKAGSSVLLFYLCYCLISTYNIDAVFRGISYFIIFSLHILILTYLLTKKHMFNIESLIHALLLVSIFVILIPHFLITGSLKLGAFYNLIDPSLLVSTTMEGPLLVALLFLLAVFNVFFNKNRSFINIFSILFSVFLLLLFNRRGFIISCILSTLIYYGYIKTKKKIILYLTFALMFLPMFWDTISTFVVSIFKSDVFSSFIIRNDTEELATATGRAITWANIIKLFLSLNPIHIFGFKGGPPSDLFLTSDDNGRFLHAHNTFLQLFLEGGYFTNILFICVLVYCIRKYIASQNKTRNIPNYYILILIFLLGLSGTETLVKEVLFSSFIFSFCLIGANLMTNLNLKVTDK